MNEGLGPDNELNLKSCNSFIIIPHEPTEVNGREHSGKKELMNRISNNCFNLQFHPLPSTLSDFCVLLSIHPSIHPSVRPIQESKYAKSEGLDEKHSNITVVLLSVT